MKRKPSAAAVAATILLFGAGVAGAFFAVRDGPLRLNRETLAQLGTAAPCTRDSRRLRGDCYRTALTGIVREKGVASAIATLEAVAGSTATPAAMGTSMPMESGSRATSTCAACRPRSTTARSNSRRAAATG